MLKVGLILYSVKNEMARDPIATAEKVASIGYKYFEVCNHNALKDYGCGFGVDAPALKEAFSKFGARVVSAHVYPLEQADLGKVAEYQLALGNTNIANPMLNFSTYDELMRQIEALNRVGKELHSYGIRYFYHNHNHEFKTFNGKPIYDYIVENTDPDYLSFELDTFWTMRAGLDPIDILKKHGKRIKLVHQKDFAWNSMVPINTIGLTPEEREQKPYETFSYINQNAFRDGNENHTQEEIDALNRAYGSAFTEIGCGIMNIQGIIDAATEYTDAEYIILEQDRTRMNEIDSVIKSMEAFRRFKNISWGD